MPFPPHPIEYNKPIRKLQLPRAFTLIPCDSAGVALPHFVPDSKTEGAVDGVSQSPWIMASLIGIAIDLRMLVRIIAISAMQFMPKLIAISHYPPRLQNRQSSIRFDGAFDPKHAAVEVRRL